MLAEALSPKQLFPRPRCDLPPPAGPGEDIVAREQVFRELVDDYNRKNTELRKTRFVCNFSGSNLTLDHINYFVTWLEGSSLRIYALNFLQPHFLSLLGDAFESNSTPLYTRRIPANGWQLPTPID